VSSEWFEREVWAILMITGEGMDVSADLIELGRTVSHACNMSYDE
jgi:hypothetical protein